MLQVQKSFKAINQGILYLIPTPIGNLEDMTFRAVRLLKEVNLILAEDTRHTIKLLKYFGIETPMASFHEHSSENHVQKYLHLMQEGQHLALVSDAGMPLINDPGHPLVQAVLAAGLSVVTLPGANAALTALVSSGLNLQCFTYYGFFPRESKAQKTILEIVGERAETAIFYESPFRVKSTLALLMQAMSEDTRVVLARELTKQYEEYIRGYLLEVYNYVQDTTLKGEFVLLLEGGKSLVTKRVSPIDDSLPLKEQVEQMMRDQDVTVKEAIKKIAKLNNKKKQEVYRAYHLSEE